MENNMPKVQSKVKKIKEPDFSQEVVITALHATKETVDFHYAQLKRTLGPNATEQAIWERLNSIILRDNLFNKAMQIIVPCYEITIEEQSLIDLANQLKTNNKSLANQPDDMVKILARRIVEKQLIFAVLSKEWNIEVTDEELKKMLDNYYKATNQPMRDVMNNPQMLNAIRTSIFEQKMIDTIISKMKWRADWKAIQENARKNNAQDAKQEEKGDGVLVER